MTILVAPDSFKGTLSASDVAITLADELIRLAPEVTVTRQPLSDGGEGFVRACCDDSCEMIRIPVTGPMGGTVQAVYGLRHHEAVVELASAAGIELLTTEELSPMEATTYGLGQVIADAVRRDVRRIWVGLGGSATHDAGMGMLRALGARFLGENKEIDNFRQVEKISSFDLNIIAQIVKDVEFICASDVTNPLLGEAGAAWIYAPQKGATRKQVRELEHLTRVFSRKLETYLGKSFHKFPGTGAAGGTAFALMACLQARCMPGFEVVASWCDLQEQIRQADLVITGEGFLDAQSSFGKAPVRLLHMASEQGKPVAGVFGGVADTSEPFDSIYSLTQLAGSQREAMERPVETLRQAAAKMVRDYRMHSTA